MTFPPSLILIFGAMLLPLLPSGFIRKSAILILPLLALYGVWSVPEGVDVTVRIAGFTLHPMYIHPYTHIFATVFCIAAFAGGMFSFGQKNALEITSSFIYAGSALGATFAGDFITLFIYWEVMAIASTVVVLCGDTENSRKAAMRYAYMHFTGGVILLAGIAAHIAITQNVMLQPLTVDIKSIFAGGDISATNIANTLILVGVLVNAGAPPFSAWIADTYPESSPFGAVFLSAFTTKTAVFVLLTLFAGNNILICVGLFMVFYGIIYAMLENDARRILSYSIINQVGFMITGIGIGTQLALFGTATHAFCHIIYKSLLLMSAGSVLYMTGKRKCTDLGGLYRTMKLTAICGIIGALAISAFPWTSGFVSKSMISSASANEHMGVVWFLLAAASAGVFLHAGIKFPWFVFFQKDSGMRPKDPPLNMRIAMVFLASMCILPGIFPQYLYMLLPVKVDYTPYTNEHVITQLQLLLFAGLAFFVMLPMLKRTTTISLDFDWIYRVFLKNILLLVEIMIGNIYKFCVKVVEYLLKNMRDKIYHLHGPEGALARNWAVGNTVLYATTMLCIFLVLYYNSSFAK